MDSSEEMLSRLKALCLKNKGKLQEYSAVLSHHLPFSLPPLPQFPQIKMQYELILTASKESIDRNSQLQAQLQSKQDYVRALKEKLSKHSRQLQDLSNEVARANGNLKKQRKSQRDYLTSEDINEKLKRDLEKMNKKKHELARQCDLLNRKQEESKTHLAQTTAQNLQIELRFEKQEARSSKRIEQLLREIKIYRQNLVQQRNLSSSRLGTPSKSAEKKKGIAQMQLLIKQFKEQSTLF